MGRPSMSTGARAALLVAALLVAAQGRHPRAEATTTTLPLPGAGPSSLATAVSTGAPRTATVALVSPTAAALAQAVTSEDGGNTKSVRSTQGGNGRPSESVVTVTSSGSVRMSASADSNQQVPLSAARALPAALHRTLSIGGDSNSTLTYPGQVVAVVGGNSTRRAAASAQEKAVNPDEG
jgi:hypothetical protein